MVDNKTPNRKPLIYYIITVSAIIMLLNAFVFPILLQRQVQTVGYSDFLKMVDDGLISQVQLDQESDQLLFIAKDSENHEALYKTALFPDDTLRDRLEKAGVSFSAQIPTQNNPLLSFIISWILPVALFSVLGRVLMNQISKHAGDGLNAMSFGKSNAKIVAQQETGVTFADVAGEEEAKDALKEIVDFLEHPEKYASIGAKLPKGALLVGPPGTGKTLLAKAVAGEAKVPFFSISGSEFVEMFVGMGAAKVRDLFKQANEKAPCIIFIDEIDAIGKKRDAVGLSSNDEREQALNQLLAEMDGFDASKGIVVLGATNRPEILDVALLRPGRFDRRITVDLPDLRGREAVLRVHARGITMDKSVDFSAIARATVGASGADLANIVNESALRAVRMGRSAVTQDDLEASVETVIAGTERKSFVIPENEKRIVAYHEIGHALVAAHQKNAVPVQKITIIPRTSGALGYTMQVDEEEHVLMKREDILAKLAVLTAGRAAEEYACNTCTTGASNDIEQATKLARAMVTRYGMSDKFGMVALETNTNVYLGGDSQLTCSMETAAQIDAEVVKLIADAYDSAMTILKNNTRQLHDLAEYLLEKENISGEEFQQILAKDNEKITLLSDSSKEEIS